MGEKMIQTLQNRIMLRKENVCVENSYQVV